MTGGRLAFGVSGGGTGDLTICGTTNVLDDQWHHIAVQRRRSDGWMWLYVDGTLEAQANGPDGDISYPDNGVPGNFCGPGGNQPCTNSDPYLVIGAEKHDAGPQFPSYSGLIDEVRLSSILRYTSNFIRPSQPFLPDANTVALYNFDEGQGDIITDSSGAVGGPSNGVRRFGGSPAGPEWVTQTPFETFWSCPDRPVGGPVQLAAGYGPHGTAQDWRGSCLGWYNRPKSRGTFSAPVEPSHWHIYAGSQQFLGSLLLRPQSLGRWKAARCRRKRRRVPRLA